MSVKLMSLSRALGGAGLAPRATRIPPARHRSARRRRSQPRGGRLSEELEPDAGAGVLAEEPPSLRDLIDQLEAAAALVLPGGLAPVRQPGLAVVYHVHVDGGTAAADRDGHPVGVV